MSRSRIALLVLLLASLLVPSAPAQAASTVLCTGYTSCNDKGYPHAGYAQAKDTSYWNMYTGTNCTNYVAYRMVSTLGLPNKRPAAGVGNARDWGTAMSSVTDMTPTIGSVAWWGKTGNHVAYVERVVSADEFWVSESNWSGAFDWRKVTRAGGGWPDGFIHFTTPALVNSAKPAITGSAQVTGTVKATDGSWSPAGNSYAHQWLIDGAPVSGATSSSFKLTSPMAGKSLSVQVTASRSGYPATSVVSDSVAVAPGTLAMTARPAVTGTPQVGSRLTASNGTWSRTDLAFTYQWFAGAAPIGGATGPTYVVGASDVDQSISVAVTAGRSGFTSATVGATASAKVIPGTFTRKAAPSVTGKPRVGSRLTATPGSWSPDATVGFQWSADGRAIDGATASTFVPTARERGATIRVRVTARRPGFTPLSPSTAKSKPVTTGRIRIAAAPAISGSPVVGSVLTIQPGTVSPAGATVRYQWLRDGKVLSGATRQVRTVSTRDLGHRLSARVTYKASGYSAVTATTASLRRTRTTPKVSVAATSPVAGTATFTIRVSASGVAPPAGRMTVSDASGHARTVAVTRGRATISLTGQAAGLQTYRVTYRGTSALVAVTKDKSVQVR